MIKKMISVWVHKLLLPRGRQYTARPDMEVGWEKEIIEFGKKQICMLWYKNTTLPSKGIIVLSHPYLAEAKSFFLIRGHAEMYIRNQYQVVLFDFNGFGESPFVDFNYKEDLSMVADFVQLKEKNLPVFGHGVSFGASHTIVYSTADKNVFQKIIVENCLDSNLSYYKKRNRKLHYLMIGLMKIFPGVNKDHDYVKSISKLIGVKDVFFIYNNMDDLTTIAMGKSLQYACNKPSRFMTFDGIHLMAFQNNKDEYTESVITFLQNN